MSVKKISLYIMSLFYVIAGINHFIHPSFYEKIMPPYLPIHLTLIDISGVCETGLGLLLLPQKTRRSAAWGIIFLLIAIYPANIQMLLNYIHENNPNLWISIVRLPLQFVLIWWAFIYTKE
jgi:uncharacterized membrane protein